MRIGPIIAALMLATGGFTAGQAHDSCAKADMAEVNRTVADFMVALGDNDQARLAALITPDFVAFDSGKRYEGLALAAMIGGLQRAGTTVRLTVNDAQVHARCGMALVTFVDKGALTTGDKIRNVTWLESAVLEHDGKNWRVKFTHATEAREK